MNFKRNNKAIYIATTLFAIAMITLFIFLHIELKNINKVIDSIQDNLQRDIQAHEQELRDMKAQLSYERFCSLESVECGLGD